MIECKFEKSRNLKDAVGQLYKILTYLRSPDGCPWDRAETQESSVTNLKNEMYEFLDELIKDNKSGMTEELGDLFLNIFMLLLISHQDKGIEPVDVLDGTSEKLIRRHPHVFGNKKAENPDEALSVWNEQKKKEGKTAGEDYFERIPKSKSAFDRTEEVQKKVRKIGFDWDSTDGIYDKITEELEEVKHAEKFESRTALMTEIGDLMFCCIDLATNLSLNPDECLHLSLQKFERRFNAVRKLAGERNIEMKKGNLKEMDLLWNEVKEKELKNE